MVGRKDDHDPLRVPAIEESRGEADTGRCVAACGLYDELVFTEVSKLPSGDPFMLPAQHHEDVVLGHQFEDAVDGHLDHGLVAEQSYEGLWYVFRAEGPETLPSASGHDDAV